MKISVITPSLNQGRFIERTIQSVLSQRGDFILEYIIIDGGSKDQSLNIIQRYENRLKWLSEPDRGQSDALNKGFSMASGNILGWLNSDDTYAPGAIETVAAAYRRYGFSWCFGNCRNIDENDREIRKGITRYKIFESKRYSYRQLLSKDFISQPAVFFTRNVFRKIGPLDLRCEYSMDYDYWLRIGKRFTPYYIDRFLANFRWQAVSKNSRAYRNAAWETYLTAKRHAPPGLGNRYALFRHYLHYLTLITLYRIL